MIYDVVVIGGGPVGCFTAAEIAKNGKSLFSQEFCKDNYEVIIVDAESKDNTREIAQEYPVRVIIDKHGSLGHQRNTGTSFGRGEYIAFIDADCRADKYWLSMQVKRAMTAAGRGSEIVTLGITPDRPETGYGYIERGYLHDTFAGIPAHRAARFLEKPDYTRALEFLSSGNHLWNSGMFVWRVDLIKRLIEKHIPELAKDLGEIEEALGGDHYEGVLEQVYSGLPRVSIDYGIMEKEDNVLVMPGDFDWDDIGSWTALERYAEKDDYGNVLNGKGVLLNTSNTFVFSPGKTVALLGVENLVVVNDRDTLLISHKDKAQEIKKVVQALRNNGLKEVL